MRLPVHEGATASQAAGAEAAARIRTAAAEDVRFLASVLEMSGRGHLARGAWDLLFPDAGERRRALEHFAGGDAMSWCHRSLFHVAELGGQACAALVAFDPADLGDTSLAAPLFESFALLGWPPECIAETTERIAPYMTCFPEMPPGTWIVENVGTREDARRRGLVQALLDHVLDLGRAKGCRLAQISCLIGNDAARSAYERAGFEVVEERRDPGFEALMGAPGFSRMTRGLSEER